MLEFNPNKRITAKEAIKDPYFDEVRIPEQEEFEICNIDLDFDKEETTVEELRAFLIEALKEGSSDIDSFHLK